jgi:glycosyltransferase involved in cell wall biosynthesis
MKNRPIVYSDVPARVSKTWRENTIIIEGVSESTSADPHTAPYSRISTLKIAWRLFRKRSKADCFVTTATLSGLGFALLQSIFPYGRKPHLMMAPVWTYPRNRLELAIRRLLLGIAFKSIIVTFVNTTFETGAYASFFKLPEEKFTFLPYNYRLSGYHYTVRDDGYIWSGGNADRDYKLLIDAVRDIDKQVIINATRKSFFEGINIPEHVKIQGVTPAEFRQFMAGCSFGVFTMEGGKLHPSGQQTFLSCMKMGKPVILTDPIGGKDYIKDGYNGFLVPFGDVSKLREKIRFLINNPLKAKEIGENAAKSVMNNSEDNYMQAIWKRACKEANLWKQKQHHRNIQLY